MEPQPGAGPFGAKSSGELSNSQIAPAIANAVADATGVRVTDLPLTPERVLAALRSRPVPSPDASGARHGSAAFDHDRLSIRGSSVRLGERTC